MSTGEPRVLDRRNFQGLLDALAAGGYRVVGPTVQDAAIVYDEVASESDLPVGWTDEQDGGKYRLKRRADAALFGYVVGPHSWKKYLYPPARGLWKAARQEAGFRLVATSERRPRLLRDLAGHAQRILLLAEKGAQ